MDFEITALAYKDINDALINGKAEVPAKGIWLRLNSEYNIGTRDNKCFLLTSADRVKTAEIVKKVTDLDPRLDNYAELTKMSRTQISKKTRFEKFLSLPPRADFLEVRILTEDGTPPGYKGMLVEDFLAQNVTCIISVENFDVFANLQTSNLDCIKALAGEVLYIVFAGDNKANPKVIKKLKSLVKVPWVHFGDFDPAGIHISKVRLNADYLILPEIKNETLLKLNNPLKFQDQNVQLKNIKAIEGPLTEYIDFISSNEVAIMQEQLISHQIPLTLVKA
jgi:hypothetical protein